MSYKSMELKLKHQELLKTITNLRIVQELPKQAIQQFSRLMKVKQDINDSKGFIEGLQHRIADIFNQEGEGYEDYLQLPKFRAMSSQLQTTLHHLFKTIWDSCHSNRYREQIVHAKKEAQTLVSRFKSFEEAEKFHLDLLNMFKESPLCTLKTSTVPPSEPQNNKMIPEVNPLPAASGNFSQQMNERPLHAEMFPCYPFPMNQGYPKLQAHEGMEYIINGKHPQPLFDVPRFPMPMPPFFSPQFFQNNQPKLFEQNAYPMPNFRYNFNEESASGINKQFQNYKFIQCSCQGLHGYQQDRSFQCSQCQYSYHHTCMGFHDVGHNTIVCPICNLRKQTIFCKVMQEPIKFYWYLHQQKDHQFKVQMTQDQTQQILQAKRNGLDCQIRFLRIDGKSLKSHRTGQGYVTEGGILHKQVKYSQITLPEFKDQSNPISLDIALRSDDQPVFVSRLYFFAVFLVSFRSVQEIVMQLFDSNLCFDEDYYHPFFNQKDRITIKFHADTDSKENKLIRYPVRGLNCKHPEVFDCKLFLQLIYDLKRDRQSELLCPICSKVCNGFKYDSLLYRKINQCQDYQQQKHQGLQIYRNGDMEWIKMPRFVIQEIEPHSESNHENPSEDSSFLHAQSGDQDHKNEEE